MGKLLLSLAALVSLSFAPEPAGNTEDSKHMTNLSIRPDPLKQGKSATISGTAGDVIDLDWDPPAEPSTITLGSDGKATFTVPRGGTSLIATGPNGETLAVTVGP